MSADGRGSRWREKWVSQVVRAEGAVNERARAWVCNERVLGLLRGWSCGRLVSSERVYQPLACGAKRHFARALCLLLASRCH